MLSTPDQTPPGTTFGERLRQLRKAAGLQQNTLADRIGVNFTYISKLEKPNGPTPGPDVITRIAKALALDEDATAELFRLAQKIPPSVERLIAQEPEAVDFYRVVNRRMSEHQRREFFRKLIDDIERASEGVRHGDEPYEDD